MITGKNASFIFFTRRRRAALWEAGAGQSPEPAAYHLRTWRLDAFKAIMKEKTKHKLQEERVKSGDLKIRD